MFVSNPVKLAARRPVASTKSLLLLLGTTLSTALVFRSVPSISNDVAQLPSHDLHSNVSVSQKVPVKSRFGGQLNYEELTIGSITGLFLGVIAGKLSSVFALLALSSYFLVQFLESRNIIHVPWNSIVQLGKERINLKQLVFEKPSFKFSFALAFLIAAFNI
ncbi:uncharacterized protein CANTADRAFT_92475 [Suhomyces tanzawaensis NRRL Y-17324]|uniref:FUN14-domain-containing protein n=1 Tax=Suhomyces tanzawaensis NRRL Y-17324 TaxID=984487 RepID=A0A1E4SBR3_9ASCO|nr:uncharacterized protein CANTADRAFT_92475 [Suhomyces tanzawaensis NRRL Y-17324]ODV76906.1 hypothetical protein CANTADRAFT_92475 [Suhomyces tanzawaensis NRRL Y-17324]